MEPDDPFEGLTFDEDFVRGGRREPSAAERMERSARAQELAELLAERQRLERRARWRRRRPGALVRRYLHLVPAVAMLLVLGAAAWQMNRDPSAGALWLAGPGVGSPVGGGRPTLQDAPSDTPLGVPPQVSSSGAHVFSNVQAGTFDPVAYDPCRPIGVVVNNRTVPPGAESLVSEALLTVTEATGLRFEIEGVVDEVPVAGRAAFQPDRYGDRWAPVLIAWSDDQEVADLAGDVAGIGGSSWIEARVGGPSVYVSGIVALDGPDLREILERPDGRAQVMGVILHELGHLVGLDHVDDPSELMHPVGQFGVDTFQDGDRAGLARLGAGECVGRL